MDGFLGKKEYAISPAIKFEMKLAKDLETVK